MPECPTQRNSAVILHKRHSYTRRKDDEDQDRCRVSAIPDAGNGIYEELKKQDREFTLPNQQSIISTPEIDGVIHYIRRSLPPISFSQALAAFHSSWLTNSHAFCNCLPLSASFLRKEATERHKFGYGSELLRWYNSTQMAGTKE